MRRASTCLALLGIAVLGLPAAASAAPTVTLVAKAVPIPGFKGTGNIYGAGAAVEAKYTIKGEEYTGGVPSPLTKVTFYLPTGSAIHPKGFVTCSAATLTNVGPEGCNKKSIASPVGSATVADRIGGELVVESATLQAFLAPGGGLNFYTSAPAPISANIVSQAAFSKAGKPYSMKLNAEVPLVQPLPEAPFVSVLAINVKVGAAFKKKGKVVSYGTLPKKGQCPKSGFPVKSELTFLSGETVTASYKAPCPKK